MPLNERQIRFCQEYLIDLNGTQAAIRAGYTDKPDSACSQGNRLLGIAEVQEKISQLHAERLQRVTVEGDRVLHELLRLGYSDIRDIFDERGCILDPKLWPEDLARAVSSIEVDELYEGYGVERQQIGVTKKVKFWNKPQSLELLGKHKKLFTDRIEHSGKLTLEQILAKSNKGEGESDG